MAYEILGERVGTLPAAADLSGDQYLFVAVTSSGINLCADPKTAFGVLQNKPTSGQAAQVARTGVTKVYTGSGGLTEGAHVTVDGNGKAIAASTGNVVVATCVFAAAAGDLASVALALTNSPAA